MKLHDFLHRTCIIIPLSNGVTVCGAQGRVYCKIRAQLGFPPTEIHANLQKVYGNGALKYATVCKWVRHFNNGWESIEK